MLVSIAAIVYMTVIPWGIIQYICNGTFDWLIFAAAGALFWWYTFTTYGGKR